jgi:hypothetical protein
MKCIASAIIGAVYASAWWAYGIWKNENMFAFLLWASIVALVGFCIYAFIEN